MDEDSSRETEPLDLLLLLLILASVFGYGKETSARLSSASVVALNGGNVETFGCEINGEPQSMKIALISYLNHC